MSILNIHSTPQRVLVAVDTRGAAAEDVSENVRAVLGVVSCTKVTYLSGCGAVLAGRGTSSMLQLVSSQAMLKHSVDFDSLVAGLPAMLRFGYSHLVDVARRSGLAVDLAAQEIAAVGYSARAGRMVATSFCQESAAVGFERFDVDDGSAWPSPWWDEVDPPEFGTPEAMLHLARLQVAAARERGHQGIGGRLIVADVQRAGAHFEDVGPLE